MLTNTVKDVTDMLEGECYVPKVDDREEILMEEARDVLEKARTKWDMVFEDEEDVVEKLSWWIEERVN